MELAGKIWKFGNNINTDLMLPGHAIFRPVEEQARFAFSAVRPGWASKVRPNDMIVGGFNFGTGSGRPAPRVLREVGISCVLAESINGLFYRNSINYGLAVIQCAGVHEAFEEGDPAEVDLKTSRVVNRRTGQELYGAPMPEPLYKLITGGGIFPLLEAEGFIEPE